MFLWQIRKYERKTKNVQKQNICVVVICLTQRAQRTQRFNSPTVHASAGVVASIRYDKRTQRQNGKQIYYTITCTSATSCRAEPATSQAIVLYSKSLRSLRALRAKRKHPGGDYYCLTQRAQRTQRYNSPIAHAGAGGVASFTATGERRGRMANIYSIQFLHTSALSCRAEPATPLAQVLPNKIFAIFACSACGKKTSGWWLYVSRKERKEGRNIWHCLCYKRIFYIFVESINDNIV